MKEDDIDSNGHMNNTIYIKIAEELIPPVIIKGYEIDFEKECFLNEKITLSLAKSNNQYIVIGEKEDNSLSFKISFSY